ncbi:hypothetical protein ACFFJN_08085 [Erwinia mallotivora]|uniref:hypothetical protein n=1 Tax=Erwinia mallotivora TaxID=69222 RepID=UPI0035F0A406
MKITEEKLLKSGFSYNELSKIKNNIERFGGTLDDTILDLARRFRTLVWVSTACLIVFILLVVFSSPVKVFAGGLSFALGIAIMSLAQPPILSYKSWKIVRSKRF